MLRYYEVTGAPLRDQNPSRQDKDTGIAVTIGIAGVVGVLVYIYYK